MAYQPPPQQPPYGAPPQQMQYAPAPQQPRQPQYAPPPQPQYGGPPGPPPGGPVMRDGKVMVAAILALTATALVVFATLSHTWLTPKEGGAEVSGGAGLWSTVVEAGGRTVADVSHLDAAKAARQLDADKAWKPIVFAYGSIAFCIVNWILIVLLALGTLVGFLRFGSGKSAGVPFALTLIPFIVGVAAFVLWFVVAVVVPSMLDGSGPGLALFLWWGGMVLTLVAAILFAKGRSRAAFGMGFQGRGGGPMPPGSGVIGGQQMMPPGAGYIPNPADALGPPGGRPPGQ